MPIVLKHKENSQIYTCMLVNHYRLEYYGTKYWDDFSSANEQYEQFLQLMGEDIMEWDCLEIEEQQMKVFNVRLKNDPSLELYLDENGRPIIKKTK
jgi:hypothetical protein